MTRQLTVALGCVIDQGRVLMVCRHEPSLPAIHGYWELPGGRISIGENPARAAVREIREETGYSTSSSEILGAPFATLRKRPDGSRLHVIGLGFLCHLQDHHAVGFLPPTKVGEVRWIPLERLDPVRVQSGSLAFIAAAVRSLGLSLEEAKEYKRVSRAWVQLQNIAPAANRRRYYCVTIQGHLSDLPEFRVLRYWGRGVPSRVAIDEFTERDKVVGFVNQQLRKRVAHGYELVQTSPDFPETLFPVVSELPQAESEYRQASLFDTDAASNPSIGPE